MGRTGTDVLQQFAAYLREPEEDELKHERMCLGFSNKWWSLVHTTRPFVIKDIDQVAQMVSHVVYWLRICLRQYLSHYNLMNVPSR